MTAKKLKTRRTAQQRIEFLLRHRRKIAMTKWDALTPMFGSMHEQILVEHDAELMAAIAAWQRRRLAEIDGQLRELGIDDVEGLEQELAKVTKRPSRAPDGRDRGGAAADVLISNDCSDLRCEN